MLPEIIKEKHDKLRKWAGIGILAVVGFAVVPFIYTAITGLIGLAIAGAVGIVITAATPWFSLKIANMKYRAIEAEKVSHIKAVSEAAAENPVETTKLIIQERWKNWEIFRSEVIKSTGARDDFAKKLEEFKKAYPHRAKEFENRLELLNRKVKKKQDDLEAAKDKIHKAELLQEEMSAYWTMSQMLRRADSAAGTQGDDSMEKVKMNAAYDSIISSMNTVFAEMEVDDKLEGNGEVLQLESSSPVVIEVPVHNKVAETKGV